MNKTGLARIQFKTLDKIKALQIKFSYQLEFFY